MLKTLFRNRVTVKQPGKISTGIRTEGGQGRGVDYFNISDFPELIAAYGEKPQLLIVYPPSDRLEDFFDDQMCLWAGGTKNAVKVRTCDGETCIHRIAEEVDGTQYGAGEETECICQELPEDHKKRCRYLVNPKFYVGLPPRFAVDNLSCYLFETHSVNSGEHLKSELVRIQKITGRMANIPFKLSVHMASGSMKASEKFPIWHLECAVTATQIRSDRILQEGFTTEELPGVTAVPALTQGQGESGTVLHAPEQIEEAIKRYAGEMDLLEKNYTRAKLDEFLTKIKHFIEVSGVDPEVDSIKTLSRRWLALDKKLKSTEAQTS